MMWATEAAEHIANFPVGTLLDVGSGKGDHANFFKSHGFDVCTVDSNPDFGADYEDIEDVDHTFDYVWCSHCLEHVPNVQRFLRMLIIRCKYILAITVPPAKTNLVGGHLTLWTPGLLAYNMVAAGLDLSQARVGSYGYNISIITNIRTRRKVELSRDSGDITALAEYFPWPVQENQADFPNVRWNYEEQS